MSFNLKIITVFCLCMGFAQSLAMEEIPSRVPTLYKLSLAKLSQEEDVEVLNAALSALPVNLAWELLQEVIDTNFHIGSYGKATVLNDFQKRPYLSELQQDVLEVLNKKALSGDLRGGDFAAALRASEYRLAMKKVSAEASAPAVQAMEPRHKRDQVIDKEKIFNLSQKIDFGLAQLYLQSSAYSIEWVSELLYAILVANFSISWAQKCELIQIVRNRLKAIDSLDPDVISSKKTVLNRVERLMLRGCPLHGLSDEELRALEVQED